MFLFPASFLVINKKQVLNEGKVYSIFRLFYRIN